MQAVKAQTSLRDEQTKRTDMDEESSQTLLL